MTTVCARCHDTHRQGGPEGQLWPCTACPTPCSKCASDSGRGPYCDRTPCPCDCHVDDVVPARAEYTDREMHRHDLALRVELGLEDDTTVLLPTPRGFVVELQRLTAEQARAVLRTAAAAGVDLHQRRVRRDQPVIEPLERRNKEQDKLYEGVLLAYEAKAQESFYSTSPDAKDVISYAISAMDKLMGDTDLDEDDPPQVAMRALVRLRDSLARGAVLVAGNDGDANVLREHQRSHLIVVPHREGTEAFQRATVLSRAEAELLAAAAKVAASAIDRDRDALRAIVRYYHPTPKSIEQLLADFFGINLMKVGEEKDAMVVELRGGDDD